MYRHLPVCVYHSNIPHFNVSKTNIQCIAIIILHGRHTQNWLVDTHALTHHNFHLSRGWHYLDTKRWKLRVENSEITHSLSFKNLRFLQLKAGGTMRSKWKQQNDIGECDSVTHRLIVSLSLLSSRNNIQQCMRVAYDVNRWKKPSCNKKYLYHTWTNWNFLKINETFLFDSRVPDHDVAIARTCRKNVWKHSKKKC